MINLSIGILSVPDWAGIVPQPVGQKTEDASGPDQKPSKPAVKGRSGPTKQNMTKTLERG